MYSLWKQLGYTQRTNEDSSKKKMRNILMNGYIFKNGWKKIFYLLNGLRLHILSQILKPN